MKENKERSQPAIAIHLFFTDGTSYEIYGAYINFAKGLNRWDMEEGRKYLCPPMENIVDISMDEP